MSARCSHVLLRVDDLPGAVADFRAAGFQVDFATAEERALHAHVWFPDGPIIELLTTPRGARWFRLPLELFFGRGAGKRMVRWARQDEGFCDVAVLLPRERFAGRLAALARAGVPSGRAVRWKRRRPDGARTEFSFAYPRNDRLPFLVTPYDPPQHPPAVAHPNGATALRTVEVGVRARDLPAFRALVGDGPGFRVREAPVTGVLAIEIAGLDGDVDPALTHGAVLRAAPADG